MMKLVAGKDPALTQVAAEVAPHVVVEPFVKEMFRVMREGKGLGLAANQVGVLLRIIVVQVGSFRQAIINPVITQRFGGDTHFKGGEGCLSFPGQRVKIVRDARVTVEGFNARWEPVRFKLRGDAAIVVQHEIDHLDGVTIKSLR